MLNVISEIDHYLKRLFPITRSITGNGNRETLRILQEIVPLTIHEVPSGTQVYDWTIPDEWNIRDAWIAAPDGRRIVDFKDSNLHVVSYSEPIERKLTWEALRSHLYTHPELPDAIPYRTSYYKRGWGFCVTHEQYQELETLKGPFEVVIDSTLQSGSLTYGEYLLPGQSNQEMLISTYICHPSMANDNLSGMVMTAFLAREIIKLKRMKRGFRFIWVPETIGAIAYCALNEAAMKLIRIGLVVTCVGGPGRFGYKQSYDFNHSINAVIEEVFTEAHIDFLTYPFDIHGSDERQYSSQGFRINVTSITKDKYYEYPFYHTSLDDLSFVDSRNMVQNLKLYLKVIERLSQESVYQNRYPKCEVMLSKHQLYPVIGGYQVPENEGLTELDLVLWLLWLCDGETGIYQIARHLGVTEDRLAPILDALCQKKVLERVL